MEKEWFLVSGTECAREEENFEGSRSRPPGGDARARATIEIFFSKVLSGGGLEEDRDCRADVI